MNIIGHKYIFLTFSGLLVSAGVLAFAVWGLKLGIDFTGGSLMEIEYTVSSLSSDQLKAALEPLGIANVTVQQVGERGWILRFKDINEVKHQEIKASLSRGTPEGGLVEKRFDMIGPTVGKTLRDRSLWALGLTVLGIVLYLAWAFRHVSKPIASWKYGIVAIATLIHDISIPTGVFAFLGRFHGVEVDSLFITALLTVMGFSVHDTIVIFDRIRENLLRLKTAEPFSQTVNRSVNDTMTRSINTSLTVLIVLFAIY